MTGTSSHQRSGWAVNLSTEFLPGTPANSVHMKKGTKKCRVSTRTGHRASRLLVPCIADRELGTRSRQGHWTTQTRGNRSTPRRARSSAVQLVKPYGACTRPSHSRGSLCSWEELRGAQLTVACDGRAVLLRGGPKKQWQGLQEAILLKPIFQAMAMRGPFPHQQNF